MMMNRIRPNSHSYLERPISPPVPTTAGRQLKPGNLRKHHGSRYCIIASSFLFAGAWRINNHPKKAIQIPNPLSKSILHSPTSQLYKPLYHPSFASLQTNTNTPTTKETSLKGSNCNHFLPTRPLHTRPQPCHHVRRKDEGPRHHR
jgi:hypothetical protein